MASVLPSDPGYPALAEIQSALCAAHNPALFVGEVDMAEPERRTIIAILEHKQGELIDAVELAAWHRLAAEIGL